jgi:hypothetical protein
MLGRTVAAAAGAKPAPSRRLGGTRGLGGMNVLLFLTDQQWAIQHFPRGWERRNMPGLNRLHEHRTGHSTAPGGSSQSTVRLWRLGTGRGRPSRWPSRRPTPDSDRGRPPDHSIAATGHHNRKDVGQPDLAITQPVGLGPRRHFSARVHHGSRVTRTPMRCR